MPSSSEPRAVVLVEGRSDQRAVEVLAHRRGRDLRAEHVVVVAMGGITNLGRHLDRWGADVTITGLYDQPEEAWVRRALARRPRQVELHACIVDLEDELIRALGLPAVIEVVTARGDLPAWETLCRQPFHRGRPEADVMRRFLGTTSGRKVEYAGLLTEALDLARVPTPLDRVLDDTLPARS